MTADSRQAPPRRPILSLANPPKTSAPPSRPILTLARPPAPKEPVATAPVAKPAPVKPAAAVAKSLRPAPKATPPKPAKSAPTTAKPAKPVATAPTAKPVPPTPKAKPPSPPKSAKVQRTPEEKAAFLAEQAELQRQAANAKQERVIAIENELRSAFPAAFPERHLPPLPLLVGIHKQLRAVTADRFSTAILKAFLESWTRQSPYVSAIADGVARHDLQGNPVGVPTEKEIALAKREMAKRYAAQRGGDEDPSS